MRHDRVRSGDGSRDASGRAEEALKVIAEQIERSARRLEERRSRVPQVSYPVDLPVARQRDEIVAAIREHQVVVVCGATGSGKTTQIPKMLLEAGCGVRGMIGHTQPRRIAARAVAARVADELQTPLGPAGVVGYKVRFTDHTGDHALIKLMTDGILLAETQGDRYLNAYDALVIDEAHERSLNIDFLLGYLRQLLPRRPDLKLVVTSATIDPQRFAEHFSLPGRPRPPVIEASGRTYPVDVVYRPLESPHDGEEDIDLEQAILRAVDELSTLDGARPDPGDVLVFLPGEREIRETAEALRKHQLRPAHRVDVIPLFARLSAEEQQRVFQREKGRRRIILATNVAETSLTVPGIRYVIDSGQARISRYSPRIKVQRLPIEPISRASANQRSGRCGRVEPGVCVRLYSEESFNARPEFTDPEILRTNLASVILQMHALELGDIEDFPFIDPPDPRAVRDGYDTLLEINALQSGGLRMTLTEIGRRLARLPIDPRIGRMLLAAEHERCLSEALVVAAALSTQDPRERPIDRAAEADAKHAMFRDEGSDVLSFLKLWHELHAQQKRLSGSAFRRWCREHFINFVRFREWHDIHHQLRELMTDMGARTNDRPARPDGIHRALLSGLLSSIGKRSDRSRAEIMAGEGEYDGARGVRFSIFPGSVLFRRDAASGQRTTPAPSGRRGADEEGDRPRAPRWVMAAEIVKTTRTYARTIAPIQPSWIEEIGGHLVKRTYAEPHWDADLARASAYETVTLFGLEIVARRKVDFSTIDPNVSRALLIQHALVGGEYLTPAKFFSHNHALTSQIKDLQERARTRDLLADTAALYAFYDQRVPRDVSSVKDFEQWRRRAESRDQSVLLMRKADVLAPGKVEPPAEQYPDVLRVGDRDLLLEYRNDPAHIEDGVTLVVPVEMLPALAAQRLEWLVPGLLREKVETLLRELPKAVRVSFVPASQTAEAALARMTFARGGLIESLTGALREMTGVYVAQDHWNHALARLPTHLFMNLRVLDAQKRVLAIGRDLSKIRRQLRGQDEASLVAIPDGPWNRSGVLLWDFGDMPESVDVRVPSLGRVMTLFPALADEDAAEEVSLRLLVDRERAERTHRLGVRKLFFVQVRRECRSLVRTTPGIEKLDLLALSAEQAVPGCVSGGMPDGFKSGMFHEQLAELIAARAWEGSATDASRLEGRPDDAAIRNKARFDAAVNERWNHIGQSGRDVLALAERVVREIAAIGLTLGPKLNGREETERLAGLLGPNAGLLHGVLLDLRVQLAFLLAPRFWTRTPLNWLWQYPRYLGSVRRRLERLVVADVSGHGGPARELRLLNEFAPWWSRFRVRIEQGGAAARADTELIQYRWMLEEFRISLWGDAEGRQATLMPVSPKRLEQQWGKVRTDEG